MKGLLIIVRVLSVCHQTGPVRLFVPYKRRKRDSELEGALVSPKKIRTASTKTGSVTTVTIPKEGSILYSILNIFFSVENY